MSLIELFPFVVKNLMTCVMLLYMIGANFLEKVFILLFNYYLHFIMFFNYIRTSNYLQVCAESSVLFIHIPDNVNVVDFLMQQLDQFQLDHIYSISIYYADSEDICP